MTNVKTRTYLFDNIKAVLIIFVVSAHFIRMRGGFVPDDIGGLFYVTAFSFIMQGFFFISGYFSKNTEKCRRTAVQNFLFPYFVFMIIMHFVRYAVFGYSIFNLLKPSFGLWFFLVMFFYRYFIGKLGTVKWIVPVSLAVFIIAGCIPFFGRYLALGRLFSFFLFFIVGYSFDKEKMNKIRSIHKGWALLTAALLLAAVYFINIRLSVSVEMWHLKAPSADYGFDIVQGTILRLIMACIAFLWIFVLIILTPDKKTCITLIGQNTLPIFVLHLPVRYIIQQYGLPGNGNLLSCILSFLIAGITVYILSRPVVSRLYDHALNFMYSGILKIRSV